MKKNILGLSFIFILFTFLSMSCAQAKDKEINSQAAPDFRLQDIHKNYYTLSSYREKKPVLLFFWTTWCPHCRRQLRVINDKYPELFKKGWELLSIDVGESPEKVDRFLRNYSLSYKTLFDLDTRVAESYDILGVPAYILINKEGEIVFRGNYFPQDRLKEMM